MFENKIGPSPESQQALDEIFKDGVKRFASNIPPGYKDKDKETSDKDGSIYFWNDLLFKRQFGDLLMWKQLLGHVKSKGLSHIILIQDDAKEDWWRFVKGKTIGPRPELMREMTNSGATLFYMYSSDNFLKYSSRFLKMPLPKQEIRQIQDAKQVIKEKLVMVKDLSVIELAAQRYFLLNIMPQYKKVIEPHLNPAECIDADGCVAYVYRFICTNDRSETISQIEGIKSKVTPQVSAIHIYFFGGLKSFSYTIKPQIRAMQLSHRIKVHFITVRSNTKGIFHYIEDEFD